MRLNGSSFESNFQSALHIKVDDRHRKTEDRGMLQGGVSGNDRVQKYINNKAASTTMDSQQGRSASQHGRMREWCGGKYLHLGEDKTLGVCGWKGVGVPRVKNMTVESEPPKLKSWICVWN